jgi:hypothetical protein
MEFFSRVDETVLSCRDYDETRFLGLSLSFGEAILSSRPDYFGHAQIRHRIRMTGIQRDLGHCLAFLGV